MSITESLRLGAFDLKRYANRNLAIAFAVALVIHMLLIGLYFVSVGVGEAEETMAIETTGPVVLEDIAPEDIPEEVSETPPAPPPMIPPELMSAEGGGGIEEVAGQVVAAPDEMVTDAPEFADFDQMNLATPEGGDGTGFNPDDMPELNMDMDAPVSFDTQEEPAANEVYDQFAENITQPTYDHSALQRRVKYPPAAREAGIEGSVSVLVVVDERGRVLDPKVMHSSSPLFVDPAVKAIRETTFTPGTMAGRPVKVKQIINIDFKLQ